MEYVLTCSCDSQDFTYNDDKFRCIKCGQEYHEDDAGKHLLETSSTKVGNVMEIRQAIRHKWEAK